ncbi:MAG TPA: xanthine dehydrogenase family protein subunit M [Candidatus Sulfomarinibacteraceae bacterium]|nr:xanthine dehydrogenase family protein subunit M [Candidatus Sulfomarinibacteraceae bacterium]
MKPAPFEFFAPESVEAALELAADYGHEAKWLAGGQSLVPAMNFRLIQPSVLLDLNRLQALDFIRQAPDGALRLGAMTRQRRLERDPTVARSCPLLADVMPYVAHPQIRNRGTLGGSMVHADPAAELPVVAVALDARFYVRSRDAERWISAGDFFRGIFNVDLAPAEMLVEVEFPTMRPHSGWSFLEVARRHGDYALVGVAALVTLDDAGRCQQARLVYLNVGDQPVDARKAAQLLVGESIDGAAIEAAADVASQEEIDPVADIHASVAYQRHLARVLTHRALRQAVARAGAPDGPADGSAETGS